MFQHSKLDELALMFRIFRRVETTLKYIIQKMSPYIEERGKKIVEDEALLKDPIEFTKKLLELKSEMDNMVENSFQNDIRFQKNRDNVIPLNLPLLVFPKLHESVSVYPSLYCQLLRQ
jgi:cullin 3